MSSGAVIEHDQESLQNSVICQLERKINKSLLNEYRGYCSKDDSGKVFGRSLRTEIDYWIQRAKHSWVRHEETHRQRHPASTHERPLADIVSVDVYYVLKTASLIEMESKRKELYTSMLNHDAIVVETIRKRSQFSFLLQILNSVSDQDLQFFSDPIYDTSLQMTMSIWEHNRRKVYRIWHLLEFLYMSISKYLKESDYRILFYIFLECSKSLREARIFNMLKHIMISINHFYSQTNNLTENLNTNIDLFDVYLYFIQLSIKAKTITEWEVIDVQTFTVTVISESCLLCDDWMSQILLHLQISDLFSRYVNTVAISNAESTKVLSIFKNISRIYQTLASNLRTADLPKMNELLLKQHIECYYTYVESHPAQFLDRYLEIDQFVQNLISLFSVSTSYKLWKYLNPLEKQKASMKTLIKLCIEKALNESDAEIQKPYLLAMASNALIFMEFDHCEDATTIFIQSLMQTQLSKYEFLIDSLCKLMLKYPFIVSELFMKIKNHSLSLETKLIDNLAYINICRQKITFECLLLITEWLRLAPEALNYRFAIQFIILVSSTHFLNNFHSTINIHYICALIILYILNNKQVHQETSLNLSQLFFRLRFDPLEFLNMDFPFDASENQKEGISDCPPNLDSRFIEVIKIMYQTAFPSGFIQFVPLLDKYSDIFVCKSTMHLYIYFQFHVKLNSLSTNQMETQSESIPTENILSVITLHKSKCNHGVFLAINSLVARYPLKVREIKLEGFDKILDGISKLPSEIITAIKIAISRSVFFENHPHVFKFWLKLILQFPDIKNKKFPNIMDFVCRLVPHDEEIKSRFINEIEKVSGSSTSCFLTRFFTKDPFPYTFDIKTLDEYEYFGYHWLNAEADYEVSRKLIEKLNSLVLNPKQTIDDAYKSMIKSNKKVFPHYFSRINFFRRLKILHEGQFTRLQICSFLDALSVFFSDSKFMSNLYNSETFNKNSSILQKVISNNESKLENSHLKELNMNLKEFINKEATTLYEPGFWLEQEYSTNEKSKYFYRCDLDQINVNHHVYDRSQDFQFTLTPPKRYETIPFNKVDNFIPIRDPLLLKFMKDSFLTRAYDIQSTVIFLRKYHQKIHELAKISQKNHATALILSETMVNALNIIPSLYGSTKFSWNHPSQYPTLHGKFVISDNRIEANLRESYNHLLKLTYIDFNVQDLVEINAFFTFLSHQTIGTTDEIIFEIVSTTQSILPILKANITKGMHIFVVEILAHISKYCTSHNFSQFFQIIFSHILGDVHFLIHLGHIMSFGLVPDVYLTFIDLIIKNLEHPEMKNSFDLIANSVCLLNTPQVSCLTYFSSSGDITIQKILLRQLILLHSSSRNIQNENSCREMSNYISFVFEYFIQATDDPAKLSQLFVSLVSELFHSSKSFVGTQSIWKFLSHGITRHFSANPSDSLKFLLLQNIFFLTSQFPVDILFSDFSHIMPNLCQIVSFLVEANDPQSLALYTDIVKSWTIPLNPALTQSNLKNLKHFYENLASSSKAISIANPHFVYIIVDILMNSPHGVVDETNYTSLASHIPWKLFMVHDYLISNLIQKWLPEKRLCHILILLENLQVENFPSGLQNLPFTFLMLLVNLSVSNLVRNTITLFSHCMLILSQRAVFQPLNVDQITAICEVFRSSPIVLNNFNSENGEPVSSIKILTEIIRYWIGFGINLQLELNLSEQMRGMIPHPMAGIFYTFMIQTSYLFLKQTENSSNILSLIIILFDDINKLCMSSSLVPLSILNSLDRFSDGYNIGFMYWESIVNKIQEIPAEDRALKILNGYMCEALMSIQENLLLAACIWTSFMVHNHGALSLGYPWAMDLLEMSAFAIFIYFNSTKNLPQEQQHQSIEAYLELSKSWNYMNLEFNKDKLSRFWQNIEGNFNLMIIYLKKELQEIHIKKKSGSSDSGRISEILVFMLKSVISFIKNIKMEVPMYSQWSLIRLAIEISNFISSLPESMNQKTEKEMEKFCNVLVSSLSPPSTMNSLFGKDSSRLSYFNERFRASAVIFLIYLKIIHPQFGKFTQFNPKIVEEILVTNEKPLRSLFDDIFSRYVNSEKLLNLAEDDVKWVKSTFRSVWRTSFYDIIEF